MKYKLPRQIINEQLKLLGKRKIKSNKLYVPPISKNNLADLARITNEIQEKGLPEYLVLKKLKGAIGYGVFLHPNAKPILKGELIAPYSGEVFVFPQNIGESSDYAFALISDLRLTREEQSQWDPNNRYHPRRLYSIDLDADKKGNFTRFINHSVKPNIEAHFVRIPRNQLGVAAAPFELLYVAKKKILPGEQLLVCYEGEDKSYWGALGIKPFPMTPKTFRLNKFLKLVSRF